MEWEQKLFKLQGNKYEKLYEILQLSIFLHDSIGQPMST